VGHKKGSDSRTTEKEAATGRAAQGLAVVGRSARSQNVAVGIH
jgi:hypothetical protein